jgi:hypothetical protein
VRKKNLTEKDKEILSSVKREMERPRQTESVRIGLRAEASLAAIRVTIHSARA